MKMKLSYYQAIFREIPPSWRWLSLFAILLPLGLIAIAKGLNAQLLLFVGFGYISALVGFWAAKYADNVAGLSLRQKLFQRLLAQNIDEVGIIYNCANASVAYVSPSIQRIMEYSQQELRNRGLLSIIHSTDACKIKPFLRYSNLKESTHFKETIRVTAGDGKVMWMEMHGKKIETDNPSLAYLMCTLRDVSERFELERSTRRFAEELMRSKRKIQSHSQASVMVANS